MGMADDDPGTDAGQVDGGGGDGLGARVDAIESKLDRVLDKIGAGEGKAHAAAEQHTEARLDRPGSVADEIRTQFDQRDREQREKATHGRVEQLEETVKKLAEVPPVPPVRRVEKFMGWGR